MILSLPPPPPHPSPRQGSLFLLLFIYWVDFPLPPPTPPAHIRIFFFFFLYILNDHLTPTLPPAPPPPPPPPHTHTHTTFLCTQRLFRSDCTFAFALGLAKETKFFMRTTKNLIRLRGCANWFESSLGASTHDVAHMCLNITSISLHTVWSRPSFFDITLGPVVQSVVSLTSSLRVISLTVLADSIYNILIFFAEKVWVAFAHCKSYSHFFGKKFSAYLRITRCKF